MTLSAWAARVRFLPNAGGNVRENTSRDTGEALTVRFYFAELNGIGCLQYETRTASATIVVAKT